MFTLADLKNMSNTLRLQVKHEPDPLLISPLEGTEKIGLPHHLFFFFDQTLCAKLSAF